MLGYTQSPTNLGFKRTGCSKLSNPEALKNTEVPVTIAVYAILYFQTELSRFYFSRLTVNIYVSLYVDCLIWDFNQVDEIKEINFFLIIQDEVLINMKI